MHGTGVDVWWAAPVDPATAPGLVAHLDGHERDRMARFRRPADAARYLAAHALTRLVLGVAAAADVFDRTCRCGEQHGKPVLPGGPAFSFTHAGRFVGVALSAQGPVGLDVEQARPMADLAAMARHIGAPADTDGFFRAWTRKEALLKATGEGLSSPMDAIVLDEDGVASWAGGPPEPVWLRDLDPASGYPAAVAGLGPEPTEVRRHDGVAVLRSVIAAG